jgi:hypothetical protein
VGIRKGLFPNSRCQQSAVSFQQKIKNNKQLSWALNTECLTLHPKIVDFWMDTNSWGNKGQWERENPYLPSELA